MNKSKKIVIIGSGNLATNLAIAFKNTDNILTQVYSRNIENAKILAKKINSSFTDNLKELNNDADFYFIAVSDKAVPEVLSKIFPEKKFLIHCAGSLNIDILKNHTSDYGVFYPVQTFLKNRPVNFKEISVCIEADKSSNEKKLTDLAGEISDSVFIFNSEKRMQIHLAAVFASNFVNHLYAISESILNNNDISFDLLRPLIREVSDNALHFKPIENQTGPAMRNDKNIIEKHIKLLAEFPDFKNIYTFVTKSIYELHSPNKKK